MKSTRNVAAFLICLPISTLTVGLRFERSEPAPLARPAPISANSEVQVLGSQTDIDWVELIVPGYEKGSNIEPPVREFIPTYHWTKPEDL
ncbi:hypothetical protein ONS95_005472 [Cadophora gregata]|uniref:uncharacterized protein n=1 Tax=Cadophora gregata TaxID=51156 RepID=UPI0026DB9772|nr:uncharacterized protein ONS95_005472 [Cadophora gregata]KAK0103449.1 hypothetical protein ONS95_005472 [Cadophora gregata]KAK0107639.1 hypothetical protein ONS96_003443 [Cadophora gregata f. sp. sojae]